MKNWILTGVLSLPEVNPEHSVHIQSNEEVIEVVKKYPDRFIWFCNIDPRMGKEQSGYRFILFHKLLQGVWGQGGWGAVLQPVILTTLLLKTFSTTAKNAGCR